MMNITTSIKKVIPFFLAAVVIFLIAYLISRILDRSDSIYVRTFSVEAGWGYQVEVNNQVYIYQPFIPGLDDKRPFPNAKTARKAGKLVEEKLKQGISPAISKEELDSILIK